MIYRFLIICTDRAYKNAKETLVIGEFAQGFNYLRRRNLIKNRGEFFISVFVLSKSNAVRLGSDSLAAARSHSGSDSRLRLSFIALVPLRYAGTSFTPAPFDSPL